MAGPTGVPSRIQVAPDSTGKGLRTTQITDALANLVEQEVVNIAGVDGSIVSVRIDALLEALEVHDAVNEALLVRLSLMSLQELRLIRYGIGKLIGEMLPGPDPFAREEVV